MKSGITKYPPGKFSKKLVNEKCNKTQSRGPLAILSGKPWHPRDFNKNPTYPFPLIFFEHLTLCHQWAFHATSAAIVLTRSETSWGWSLLLLQWLLPKLQLRMKLKIGDEMRSDDLNKNVCSNMDIIITLLSQLKWCLTK